MMEVGLGRGPEARRAGAVFGPRITVNEVLYEDRAGVLEAYDASARAALAAMARYVLQFLTSEHPDLGRPGAVCPFARQAADQGRIRITACSSSDEAAIVEGVGCLRSELVDLEEWPEAEAGERHRAIIAVFPHLSEPDGAPMIERIQKSLKLSFVEGRLMIGQFFPGCSEPGLWNPDFRPLRSPVISLAMRNITMLDAPFMLDRVEYIDAFVRTFGSAGRDMIAKAARDRALRGAGCPHDAAAAGPEGPA
jgi:hypothetical protein